ncbi:hypothetical protein HAX54_020015 [Datura stramonium]|uniref:Uncharacterized protein n=1 Tax=Datura stramonium TaxID=4076 RepID=A0ABS8UQD2_DATST|nr:hypothetical protein [Datura stramonium]
MTRYLSTLRGSKVHMLKRKLPVKSNCGGLQEIGLPMTWIITRIIAKGMDRKIVYDLSMDELQQAIQHSNNENLGAWNNKWGFGLGDSICRLYASRPEALSQDEQVSGFGDRSGSGNALVYPFKNELLKYVKEVHARMD